MSVPELVSALETRTQEINEIRTLINDLLKAANIPQPTVYREPTYRGSTYREAPIAEQPTLTDTTEYVAVAPLDPTMTDDIDTSEYAPLEDYSADQLAALIREEASSLDETDEY